jgi:hypothetical protein
MDLATLKKANELELKLRELEEFFCPKYYKPKVFVMVFENEGTVEVEKLITDEILAKEIYDIVKKLVDDKIKQLDSELQKL